MIKKIVGFDENDCKVFEREARQHDQIEKKVFGLFTIADILKVGSIWVAITVLVIGFDYRLKYLEADRVLVANSMAKLADFVKSSDTFNSSFFSTPFDNGKPINPSYRPNNKGSVNQ